MFSAARLMNPRTRRLRRLRRKARKQGLNLREILARGYVRLRLVTTLPSYTFRVHTFD